MVMLYVAGKPVGTWAEAEKLLPEILARGEELEFRDETGATLRKYTAAPEPICPWHPEWTRDDIDRMHAEGGGIPLAEFWKRMGVE
jgi:hypothetical protein